MDIWALSEARYTVSVVGATLLALPARSEFTCEFAPDYQSCNLNDEVSESYT